MDRYFLAKSTEKVCIPKEHLHLIGLVSVFLSSKMEDIEPIALDDIMNNAGHGKFKKPMLLAMELEIMTALSFKIHTITLFEHVFTKLAIFLSQHK